MFKKLILTNFQCHKKKIIKLDPHVTIITGRNDSGKTSVTRGLYFISLGKPSGNTLIRHKQKSCSVELFFDESKLKRVAGKKGNYYIFDGKKYSAVGQGKVPEGISSALALQPLNFQSQHKPLFWFDLTPGQVAKQLNELVDLESIDKVQSEVAKRLRSKKAELEVARKRLEEAEQEIKRFKPVVGLDSHLTQLTQIEHAIKSSGVDSLASRLNQLMAAESTARNAGNAANLGAAAVGSGRLLLQSQTRLDSAALLGGKLAEVENLLSVSIPRLPEPPKPDQTHRLSSLIKKISNLNSNHKQLEKSIQEKNEEIEEKLRGFCPLCGGILTGSSLI